MRDAFGGVFMFNLFIVFIFIYVAFAAVSLNYAKAFRLKNSLISFVEEQEIISLDLSETQLNGINEILNSNKYYKTCDSIGTTEGKKESAEGNITEYCHNGIIIRKIDSKSIESSTADENEQTTAKIIKYEIMTFADWNLGALNKLLALSGQRETDENRITGSWRIVGQAQVVARN